MTRKSSSKSVEELKVMLSQEEDLLRPIVQIAVQEFLEAEMQEALGVGKGERSAERLGYRSGYYPRKLITRVGTLELRVPQDRQGRFSTEIFSRYQRSEKALVAALVEMYVQGVSTRKVKAISEELCGTSSVPARSANSTPSSMGNWSVLPGKRWKPSIPTSSWMPATRRCAKTA